MPRKTSTTKRKKNEKRKKKKISTDVDPKTGIREERGKRYGPIFHSHRTIGMAIQSVIESWLGVEIPPIPPHICALILAATKLSRASRQYSFDIDDRNDLANYNDFAAEMDPRNPDFDSDKHYESSWFMDQLNEKKRQEA